VCCFAGEKVKTCSLGSELAEPGADACEQIRLTLGAEGLNVGALAGALGGSPIFQITH